MASFDRNGDEFESYFTRWDLMGHMAISESGELLGFAISGAEGRGKVFLYELHVSQAHRSRGVATALLELVEKSGGSRGRTSPTVELNVHAENTNAIGFYEHRCFVRSGEMSGGSVLVMRRKC